MSLPAIINPLAEADLVQAKAWYQRRLGLGEDFLLCVEQAFDPLRQNPEQHAIAFRELRVALVRRFPYIVVYRLDDDQITVVAVYHTSRDPRGWQQRD